MSRRRAWLPDGRTRILGIVGRPLEHSLSPALQSAVLRRLDRNLIYLPLPVLAGRLPALLSQAHGLGILGFNVTTPYKEEVARRVRPLDRETVATRMVNTVVCTERGPAGCSTDGAGIVAYLRAAGLGGAPYGVLGFGPTARSLVFRGAQEGHPPVLIVTRRPGVVRKTLAAWDPCRRPDGRAGLDSRTAVAGWSAVGRQAKGVAGSRRPLPRPAVWVSALPADLLGLPADLWGFGGTDGVLLDMNYGVGRTRRVEEARAHGWRAADGLGPLCHQAALSLSMWLGEEVPVRLYFRVLDRTERSLHPGL